MAYSKAHKYSDPLVGISNLAKTISHPARLKILFDLQKGPLRTIEMAENHPITQKTLSGHVQILLQNELIFAKCTNSKTTYHFNKQLIPDLIGKAINEINDDNTQPFIPKPPKNLIH